MSTSDVFQIRSKRDARYFAEQIRSDTLGFTYFASLMGVSGGVVTIECPMERREYKLSSYGAGWRNEERKPISDIVDYIWKDRKLINEELRYSDSEWHKVPNRTGQHRGRED